MPEIMMLVFISICFLAAAIQLFDAELYQYHKTSVLITVIVIDPNFMFFNIWHSSNYIVILIADNSFVPKVCDLWLIILNNVTFLLATKLKFFEKGKFFSGGKSPFCGVTGTLCFRLQLTLSMDFKARVNTQLPVLCSPLHIMMVNSDCSGQVLVPILHLGIVRLLLEWPPNVTFGLLADLNPPPCGPEPNAQLTELSRPASRKELFSVPRSYTLRYVYQLKFYPTTE